MDESHDLSSEAAVAIPAGLPSEDELIARFSKWGTALDAHWGDWANEARQSYDFYANRQWTAAEEEALKGANRLATVMNQTTAVIDAVSGAEIMGRQEAAYFPREVGDSAVNEILTKGAEWVRDQTNADFEESEATRDAFICGMGWTETRMDYEQEFTGRILIERVDPLQMAADPSHQKPNCEDARYLRRKKPISEEDFSRLWPGQAGVRDGSNGGVKAINRRERYAVDKSTEVVADDEVLVCEWQWFERETVWLTAGADGELQEVSEEDADALKSGGIRVLRVVRRKFYRAFTAGEQLLQVDELPDGEFTYKAITGKRDRNKRVWFGLMRLMMDPQKWANSFFSQIIHIVAHTTKGGVLAEDGAIDDVRQFEDSLARADKVTLVPEGALTQGKIQQKHATAYPAGMERLMELASGAIAKSTGVNQELMGLVQREQPGVLEDQRKRAAYGILAAFFDSLRRYRKMQGGLLLKLMRYLPPGYLVRIIGQDGAARYVPLAMDPETQKFDVVVDESEAGPNQKERVWATAMQLQPILKELGPEEWTVLLEYSPFPASIVEKFKQAFQKQAQTPPDPMAEAGKQAALAEQQGKAAKAQGEGRQAAAEASVKEAEAAQLAQAFGWVPGGPGAAITGGGAIPAGPQG